MADPHAFDYQGTFELPLARHDTWATLEQTENYESWWPWMRHLEVDGYPLEPGTTFSFLVVAPIPVTMRLRVHVGEASPPEAITATIAGDLGGTASMKFEEQGPARTVAHIAWNVEVVRPALRSIARVTRPLLLWGQTWAVNIALKEFRRHLDAA